MQLDRLLPSYLASGGSEPRAAFRSSTVGWGCSSQRLSYTPWGRHGGDSVSSAAADLKGAGRLTDTPQVTLGPTHLPTSWVIPADIHGSSLLEGEHLTRPQVGGLLPQLAWLDLLGPQVHQLGQLLSLRSSSGRRQLVIAATYPPLLSHTTHHFLLIYVLLLCLPLQPRPCLIHMRET